MKPANDVADLVDDRNGINLKERSDSLVGRIAADVARAIIEGQLAPGADLNSVELAARFGTSRTPVREALLLLEKEGLVEVPPRRRPRVSHVSIEEIEELYQIRVALNGLMIRSFVCHAGEEAMQQMSPLLEQVRRTAHVDIEGFQTSRRILHNHWVGNCGNRSLQELLSTWKMRMSVSRLVRLRSEDIERSVRDHDRLVMACQDRDETLAVALMQSMTLAGLRAIKRQQHERA